MLTITCPECGKTLRAPDDSAGRRARCPTCGALIEITAGWPAPDTAPSDPPPTAASPPEPARQRDCPACHAVLPAGAVLCTTCGYDFRTRQSRQPPAVYAPPPSHAGDSVPEYPWIRFISGVVTVVGWVSVGLGVLTIVLALIFLAMARPRDMDGFGAFLLIVNGVAVIVGGIITVGMGEALTAFRDMARNSWRLAGR
jgi:phage FluMu protein Com